MPQNVCIVERTWTPRVTHSRKRLAKSLDRRQDPFGIARPMSNSAFLLILYIVLGVFLIFLPSPF